MKVSSIIALLGGFLAAEGFSPINYIQQGRPSSALFAKYNTMDEILALFPEDMPVLINFYDERTENEIKDDIFRAKTLLKDRATLVSVKQQDYPDLAKLWDCAEKSPSMILFKDGQPVTRLYEETHYLEIVAKVGQYCRQQGEEHKPISS